jgi:hypothetical protein
MDLNNAGERESGSCHWIDREEETCWIQIVLLYSYIHIECLLKPTGDLHTPLNDVRSGREVNAWKIASFVDK